MYQYELNNISSRDISSQLLIMTEKICDECHIENDFGIISTALQQLIEMLNTQTSHKANTYSATFTVDNQQLTVSLEHQLTLPHFNDKVLHAESDEAFLLARLIDHIESNEDGTHFDLEFALQTDGNSSIENQWIEDRQMTLLEQRLTVCHKVTSKE